MAEIKLTPEQLEAVQNSGGALLVSAAAGSGKTKVLVDRLLNKVLDSDSGCDVDDFLIITYTNAAAAELRNRILDAIFKKIADDPENKRLRRQADLCIRAEIETIHSFCSGIIRENAHLLDISPDFRVSDDFESESIKNEVLSNLLDEEYDSGDEGFYALADTMGAGRDDSALASIILDTHTKLLSHPYPDEWVKKQIAAFSNDSVTDAADTVWGQAILKKVGSWLDFWTARFRGALSDMASYPDFEKAYGASMNTTYEGLLRLKSALNSGWDAAREACLGIEFPRPKGKGASGCEDIKAIRDDLKGELKKIAELLHDTSEKSLSDMRKTAPEVICLLNLVLEFDRRYSAEKRRRGVIDFSDQEHLALKLLIDKQTGKPTETARTISQRFVEIMVDEYQDVNAIQEKIFGAVSKANSNIFMVGDVKQSIYRFRLADPTIFLEKYGTFKDYGDAKAGEGRKVILSKNFRSRKGVLDGANFVFKNIMSRTFGDLDYTDKEALYYGASYAENGESSIELDVIDISSDEESEKPKSSASVEANFAAQRIKELVGKMLVSDGNGGLRTARYGDIAVIMRSPKQRVSAWLAAFTMNNIPVSYDTGSDFFETIEISTMISLLTVIDNPHQDIPIVSVLRSPIYKFSAEDLAEIRAQYRDCDFYDAIVNAAQVDDKCRKFVSDIDEFRKAAPDLPSDKFLWHVYNSTEYIAYASAMPDGAKRRKNLMLLLECAKKFEASGYKGLFSFVNYMRKLMESGKNPAESDSASSDNAVTIMSIHKSKGLEFPIVILADLTHQFNTDDSQKPLLIHPQIGVGPRYTSLERRIFYPTIARKAVRLAITGENLSEELRVLYVAMTRAKEKLIMLCTYKDAEKSMAKLCGAQLPVAPQILEGCHSAAEWILTVALRREESESIRFGIPNVPVNTDGEKWEVNLIKPSGERFILSTPQEPEIHIEEPDELTQKISKKLQWSYPYRDALKIPSKITATELKGNFSEEETHEEAEPLDSVRHFLRPPERPDFAAGSKKLTAAQKGTAAHLVMQYADYSKCLTIEGVKSEIKRLRAIHNLSDEQAAAVRPGIIANFFNSEIGRELLASKKVWRELKFSVLVDSGSISGYPGGEKLLLQGVVDCCYEKNGKLVILDFKTDYVTQETVMERAEFYRGQLEAYSAAMMKMMKMDIDSVVLYFLSAGIAITL